MTVVVTFTHIADRDLANALSARAADIKRRAELDSVETAIEEVLPFGEVVLRPSATESMFWTELIIDILADGEALDNFIAGRPLCND